MKKVGQGLEKSLLIPKVKMIKMECTDYLLIMRDELAGNSGI